jgi:hypothetical protein
MHRSSLGRLGLLAVGLLGLLSLFSNVALASGPPIVTVGAATEKSLNTANLNGTVDKNGASSATVKVEYGKTKLYGQSVSLSNVTGTGAVAVSLRATGLEPLSTYHFRIVSTNSFGTTTSADMTFEMLLAWKVEGKKISELSEKPLVDSRSRTPITIERMIAGKPAKVTCRAEVAVAKLAVLEQEYNLPFKECKMTWDGTSFPECTPPDIVLHLNAFAATTSAQNLFLGADCFAGETVPLSGGYSLGAEAEGERIHSTLTRPGYWTVNYGPVDWDVIGPFIGKTFGIS